MTDTTTVGDGRVRLTGGTGSDGTETYVAMCRNGHIPDFGYPHILREFGWTLEPVHVLTVAEYDALRQEIAQLRQQVEQLRACADPEALAIAYGKGRTDEQEKQREWETVDKAVNVCDDIFYAPGTLWVWDEFGPSNIEHDIEGIEWSKVQGTRVLAMSDLPPDYRLQRKRGEVGDAG